jgi:hypothetical protein
MGVLHWWISAGTKMAEGPGRRVLSYDEIMHYLKVIIALAETDRLMKEIEKIVYRPPINWTKI